jgi:hypothetical protein
MFNSFYNKKGMDFIFRASRSLRQLLRENQKAAIFMSEDVLSHIERMPFTISQIDVLCPSIREDFPKFLLLSGDRVYTA